MFSMLKGEISMPYEYNGIKFEIGDVDSFYYLKRGSTVWLKYDRNSVYKELIQMDKRSVYMGIPVSYLLDCFDKCFALFYK